MQTKYKREMKKRRVNKIRWRVVAEGGAAGWGRREGQQACVRKKERSCNNRNGMGMEEERELAVFQIKN
jgi:hypothetical protein